MYLSATHDHNFFSPHFFKLDIFFIYISNAIPKVPYTLPPPCPLPIHSYFLALEFPCTGAYKVCQTKGPLFPMMADQAIFCYICSQRHELWGTGQFILLFHLQGCRSLQLLGTSSSSYIGGPVFHPIDDCEHPLMYLPGTGIASQETAISGSFQHNLTGICNSVCVWWLVMGCTPGWGR